MSRSTISDAIPALTDQLVADRGIVMVGDPQVRADQ